VLSNKRVLVCGLVRDCARTLERQIQIFSKACIDFSELHFYFVESDSTDDTIKILERARRTVTNLDYRTLGKLQGDFPDRIERIRFCRNNYVEFIRAHWDEFDYVVVADFDGINSKLNRNSIDSCFNSDVAWDMCSANQKHGYYDIYALRASNWCEVNFMDELSKFGLGLTSKKDFQLRTKFIYEKMRKISKNSEWIRVDSAFGGLAIYRSEVFLKCDYTSLISTGRNQCEHVDFNLKLSERGYKLYINPGLINSHWNTYNINRFKIIRRIRGFRRKLI